MSQAQQSKVIFNSKKINSFVCISSARLQRHIKLINWARFVYSLSFDLFSKGVELEYYKARLDSTRLHPNYKVPNPLLNETWFDDKRYFQETGGVTSKINK